jgi:hypothetical protein
VRCALQNDISAFAPIATVRTTVGNEFFAPKAYTSATAVSGLNGNEHFINKFHAA